MRGPSCAWTLFLVSALAPTITSAKTITLPTVTPTPLVHSYGPSPAVDYTAYDQLFASGSAASGYAAGTYTGGYGPGDVVTLRFAAPAGYRYQFNPPAGADFCRFSASAEFAAADQPNPLNPGLTPTIEFGDLTGTAPTISGNSYTQDGQGTGLLGADISTRQVNGPFSFTSVTVTFTIPSGDAAPAGTSLSLVRLFFTGLASLPKSVGDPGPFFTLQSPWRTGDANKDGRVNADDYALIDRGFARHLAAGSAGWSDGDFNGDGSVTPSDYLLIDTEFSRDAGGASASLLATREAEFGSGYVADLLASLPEPSALAPVSLVLLGTLRGHRKRRQQEPRVAEHRRVRPSPSAAGSFGSSRRARWPHMQP